MGVFLANESMLIVFMIDAVGTADFDEGCEAMSMYEDRDDVSQSHSNQRRKLDNYHHLAAPFSMSFISQKPITNHSGPSHISVISVTSAQSYSE
jgi:hypothetical protein